MCCHCVAASFFCLSLSPKQRIPAWCDRVLWHKHDTSYDGFHLRVTPMEYTSHHSYRTSDHKPVSATFFFTVCVMSGYCFFWLVSLCLCVYMCLFICLSVDLCLCVSHPVCLGLCVCIRLSVYLLACLSIGLSVCVLSVCVSVSLSVDWSVCLCLVCLCIC